MPLTLGLRAQAMKLKFAAPDTGGPFHPAGALVLRNFHGFSKALQPDASQADSLQRPSGGVRGLLYCPVLRQGQAVRRRAGHAGRASCRTAFGDSGFKEAKPDWRVQLCAGALSGLRLGPGRAARCAGAALPATARRPGIRPAKS
ncbi:MAG: hypothetical protein MZV70_76210 [Desulfobacterales bacterium]|nr:hypothetical protein [Desulfobacterales bacterium]